MNLTFNAIDVETANSDPATICQIGIVVVRDGVIETTTSVLVNPEARFNPVNIGIHGIDEDSVGSSPALPQLEPLLRNMLERSVVASHTLFDQLSLNGALKRYGLQPIPITWLDSSRIARIAWPERFRSRWNLAIIADYLGIEFHHHDAAEDARAAAEIIIRASKRTGFSVADWVALNTNTHSQ